jgi:putative spermidine/putrescine transport system permease protein
LPFIEIGQGAIPLRYKLNALRENTEGTQLKDTDDSKKRSMVKHLARLERREKFIYFAFLIPLVAYLLVFFIYPLISFLPTSVFYEGTFSFDKYVQAFTKPVYLRIFLITFQIAALTTLLALVMGYPVAYWFTSASGNVKTLITAFIILPFWTSVIVRMYAWMSLLGHNGVFNRLLMELDIISSPIPLMFNLLGVIIGMVHFMLPYMVLSLYAVMSGIPHDFMQAGANLGAPPVKRFLKIYLPLTMPGIGAGCLLVFIISLAFFVTPALLGGLKQTMIAQVIEQEMSHTFDWSFAAALSTILIVITVILYAIYNRLMSVDRIYEGKGL